MSKIKPETDTNIRKQIQALFNMNSSDMEIARYLGLSIYKVRATRGDMGLSKSTAPKHRVTGGFDKTGIPTVKKNPTNSSSKVDKFLVFRAFLDQDGNKNMASIARQFNCSRSYVSKVIMEAREAGLILSTNRFYKHDHRKLVREVLKNTNG